MSVYLYSIERRIILTLIEPGGGRRDPPLWFFSHNSGYGYAIISNEPSKFRFL